MKARRVLSLAKSARFLLEVVDPMAVGDGPGVLERRPRTPGGTSYCLYEPARAARTWITVHGMTLAGEMDRRLVGFSRALARRGVRAAAVELPGLKNGRFERGDLSAITDLSGHLARLDGRPAGIVAFSFGAGISLTAAADDAGRGTIDTVISFGAYHSLYEALQWVWNRYSGAPRTDEEWDNHLYLRFLMAHALGTRAGISRADGDEVARLLRTWCEDRDLAPRRAFCERALNAADLRRLYEKTLSRETLRELSPAGRTFGPGCRVLLLHDANDPLIPPVHSKRISAELRGSAGSGRHRLLVTPALSHVNAGSFRRVQDVAHLVAIMAAVFE
ncbi:MAG: alpha/beta hydrolase [Deltaproteobacteria bacterium]|nr:alpha/beta hydrolase [Deltaproteobacteria bacterium]